MISKETFWKMKWESGTLGLKASQLAKRHGVSEKTVRNWLKKEDYSDRPVREVDSILDPYKNLVNQMLHECSDYSAQQIYQRLSSETAYNGSYSTVCRYVNGIRPPTYQPYLNLHFEAGDAVQVDFGLCGHICIGNTRRRLSVLLVTLCHSRLMYAEFVPCERQEHFLSGIQNSFNVFGGVPRRVIVDNLKSAVLKHKRNEPPVFNSRFLDFAGHYGFKPVACNPYSPHEKGVVENGVGYVKKNFMTNREFGSLPEAQGALRYWLDNTANIRKHGTTGRRPAELFNEEERSMLQQLNPNPFDCATPHLKRADKRCRVWFDSNSYSVPGRCSMQKLLLKAAPDKIYIYFNNDLVAIHSRCYDRKREIVDPNHYADIRRQRQTAKEQNLKHDFLKLGRAAAEFCEGLELKQINPKSHLRKILTLAEHAGAEIVADAIEVACEFQAFSLEYIETIVRQKLRDSDVPQGQLHVPNAGDHLKIKIKQPDLSEYLP
jgi:transposase